MEHKQQIYMNEPEINANRLILRPFTIYALQEIVKAYDAGEYPILPKSVLSEVRKNAMIKKQEQMLQIPREFRYWYTYFAIERKEDGAILGFIGAKGLPDQEGLVEFGYALAAEYRGRGYMTEALEGFLDYIYTFEFIRGAVLYIKETNEISKKVADRVGFKYQRDDRGFQVYTYLF
ncbi:MAG: GNAT family N-acetyltransferase [Lachnospiraceae bacterium]